MPSSTSSSSPARVSRGRSWLAFALFGLGFALSTEVATRIDQSVRYGAPFLGAYSYDSALLDYDEYGVRGRANGAYEKWRLNTLGFRGPEVNELPSLDELRVVALGASDTFGLYESPGSEWPRVFERELLARGVHAEVLNGAMAGATPAAQLQQLRHRLLPLSPDLVVWVVHYSSFAGLDPVRLEDLASARPKPPEAPGWAAGLVPRLPRRLRDALLPRLPARVREVFELARVAQLARLRSRMGDAFGSLIHVSEGERASFEYFLESVARDTQSANALLVVVLPPRRIDDQSFRLQSLSFPYVARSWLEDALETFADAAKMQAADGVPAIVVDLRDLFGSDAKDFMVDAVHFDDAGAFEFAEGILPYIDMEGCRRESSGRLCGKLRRVSGGEG